MKKIYKVTLLIFFIITQFSFIAKAQILKAYFPSYRSVAQANAVNYSQLTDVIYAFASLDASGNLTIASPTVFNAVKSNCASNGVRLWVAVGGWGGSGNFSGVASSATNRANFANACLNLCTTNGLAGIDIDWEFPTAGDKPNVTLMFQDIKAKFGTTYKLSAALGGESFTYSCVNKGHAVGFEAAAFTYLDYANIMTYDAPAACFPNHTSQDFMERSMDGWNALGCPYNKMVAGLAFYGKCAAIVEYFNISAADPSGYFNDADGIYGGYCYDSKPTIMAKTNSAVCTKGAAGMMIWEVSQDRNDAYALLPVARTAVNACACPLADPNLGSDVSICGVASVTLNSGLATNAPNRKFTWRKNGTDVVTNSTTANTYSATSAGTYDVVITEGTCSKTDQIIVTSTLQAPALGSDKNICSPAFYDLSPSNLSAFPAGTTWQWSLGGSSISGETNSTLSNVRKAGTYRLTASISGCASTFDDINITSSLPIPVDGCKSSSGQVTIGISGAGAGPYTWWDALSGGNNVGSGTSILSPSITSTKTYYVQDGASSGTTTVGLNAVPNSFQNPFATSIGLNFTVSTSPVNIQTVDIYTGAGAGSVTIEVQTSAGVTVYSMPTPFTYNAPSDKTKYTVTVNANNLAPGNYKLTASGSGTLFVSSAPTYPLTGGNVSITGSYGLGSYVFFYNWVISGGSGCDRLPVVAKIGSCGAVPVTFSQFEVSDNGSNALISWSTSLEFNNDHFEIERSFDGNTFEVIGKVNGSGNSNTLRQYSFTDKEPNSGIVYYRVAQYDIDGTSSFTAVKSINRGRTALSAVVSPNPFNDVTNLSINNLNKGKITLRITDLAGSTVFEQERNYEGGSIKVGDNLDAGVFILYLISDDQILTQKIIKLQ